MKRSDPSIVVEQVFDSSPDRIWKAITDPDEMRQWFFEQMPDFRPEVGFHTEFLITNEGRNFTHTWTLTEVIPKRKVVYQWRYPEYSGDSRVYFEIKAHEPGCILRVTTEILEDYPDDIPEFKRESCENGWIYFIQQRLPAYLE